MNPRVEKAKERYKLVQPVLQPEKITALNEKRNEYEEDEEFKEKPSFLVLIELFALFSLFYFTIINNSIKDRYYTPK